MAKRTRNRMELREQFDAAERQSQEGEADETEEVEDDEEEEEEEGGDAEAGAEADDEGDDDDEGGDDDDEDAPKKKKKKAVKPAKVAKPKAKPRSRAAKIVRKRVVWGVFNNSNQRVATFDFPKKKDAYDKAAQLTTDKKQTHFVQPVKEEIAEEKKEK